MPTVAVRRLPALLSAALTAGLVAGAGGLAHPAVADGAPAPLSGTYALNATSIWAKQSVVLTETALSTDPTPDTPIVRTVTWGDGTSSTFTPGATTVSHSYARTGNFPVAVSLADDGQKAVGTVTGKAAVAVAGTPGTYKLSRTSAWTGRAVDENGKFTDEIPTTVGLKLSGVPATATSVKIYWGDKTSTTLARTVTATSHRYVHGKYAVSVALVNANGESATKAAGTFTVTLDNIKPTGSVTVPKNAGKRTSWRRITGKAADRGLGIDAVSVIVVEDRGGILYYYDFAKKKWAKIPDNGNGDLPRGAYDITGPTKGVWKTASITTPAKGYLTVGYAVFDKANNWTGWKYYHHDVA